MRKINDGLTNDQRHYKKNKEYYKTKAKIWKKNHPEAVKKFNHKTSAKYYTKHREEIIRKHKMNLRNHPEKIRKINNKSNAKLRIKVLDKFGRKCNNPDCPIPPEKLDFRSLQLDHINDDGWKERALKYGIYRKALKDPKDYQLLCAYCNWMKRFKK